MYDLAELKGKWQNCWQDLSVDRSAVNRVFELLVTAYTRSDRYYHNLTHIQHILTTIERITMDDCHLSLPLVQNIELSLAAWFHDFIYDSQASDNEIQSAKAAGKLLANIGVSTQLIDRVHDLILATQGHQLAADDLDRNILLDADLAILGADLVQYQAYQQSIRREYSWVNDSIYQTGRIQVLKKFLQRDRIYSTELLFNELESIARSNIDREIVDLGG